MGKKEELTAREIEVLQLLCQGFTREQIAQRAFISPETVKSHIKNAYRKLDVRNKIEALQKMKWI